MLYDIIASNTALDYRDIQSFKAKVLFCKTNQLTKPTDITLLSLSGLDAFSLIQEKH